MGDLHAFGTVTPDHFRRIREIFESALEQPAAERRAFVERACCGDTVLFGEVERMLAADGGQHGLLDGGAPLGAAPSGRERPGPDTCLSCNAPLAATHRFCPACGSPVVPGLDEGRFRAGALFANRFRIVARLGRGGMGEVYRADDLELGQPVALKFLSGPAIAVSAQAGHYARFDERARVRLRSEVRLARQISHANVCRVYDIGEAHGELYLSMEYVDGEDLAALLKRIGRLPLDKGIEIARKLCAGLAAAHAKGVLHRDFKPANIMIDSQGEVRIMDFGLAAIASELDAADVRSGTPAYMAPEQLAGKEATKQSDLYALGLVLYELFTGKPAFAAKSLDEYLRLREAGPATTPSTLIPELSPRLERAILHCLEPDAKLRPASVLEVSASLPGGDPLAEALAAGETPSPEMVAAAGQTEGLRPKYAIALAISTAVCLAIVLMLTPEVMMLAYLPLRHSPEELRFRARDIVRSIGHTEDPADVETAFRYDERRAAALARAIGPQSPTTRREQWRAALARSPWPLHFRYQQSAVPLIRTPPMGPISGYRVSPAELGDVGLVSVDVGVDGRLLRLDAPPPSGAPPTSPIAPPVAGSVHCGRTRYRDLPGRDTDIEHCRR